MIQTKSLGFFFYIPATHVIQLSLFNAPCAFITMKFIGNKEHWIFPFRNRVKLIFILKDRPVMLFAVDS